MLQQQKMYFSLFAALTVATLLSSTTQALTYETVPVGNAGNGVDNGPGLVHPSDPAWGTDFGAVAYDYNIGKYEVTAGQYTEFLNAVAATDTFELYSSSMGGTGGHRTRIFQSGAEGSFTYNVEAGYEDRPVNFVSVADGYRFANWLHNGQPTGGQDTTTTEDGSYTMNGANTSAADVFAVTRNAGATWAIPSRDEWYKAAYHKNDGVTANYWNYPTSQDAFDCTGAPAGYQNCPSNYLTDPDPDEGNNATYYDTWNTIPPINGFTLVIDGFGTRTVVGAHENSIGPYGTLDQGGNVVEWTQTRLGGAMLALGGGYAQNLWPMEAGFLNLAQLPTNEFLDWGFRLVELATVPSDDADFDGDGDIDGTDFLVWQQGSGTTGTPGTLLGQGDANGDGTVDGLDLGVWETQYGTTAIVSASAAVPEPSSLMLLLAAGAVLAVRRQR